MEKMYEFQCKSCGKKMRSAEPPECCGAKMEELPLDACSQAFGPENSRSMDSEEPCDDSRGG